MKPEAEARPVDAGKVSDRLSRESLDADALSILKGKDGKGDAKDSVALHALEITGAPEAKAKPEAPEQRLSGKEIQKIAEAIDNAANGGFLGIGTDKEAINEQLRRLKTPEERETLDRLYKNQNSGHDIEAELKTGVGGDSDLGRSMALWKGQNDTAAGLNTDLIEHGEYWGVRSNANVAEERHPHQPEHHGPGHRRDDQVRRALWQVVQRDHREQPDISRETKEAVDIYLKGTDKRTDADTGRLARTALQTEIWICFRKFSLRRRPGRAGS
ncbi:MAG: hypothetical protein R3C24_17220 [Cyanobacteriota/Melainabacteria group bacterium]